ncbi:MAG TPA: hypothetical protein VHY18_08925 [Solirubrobacteraceae bacterium]|nr:hypothetical protein [Solirubrobacteraceae bacterium]
MRVDGRQHAAQPDRIERISRRPPAAITDQLSEARLDDFGGPGTPGARQQSRARQSELSGPSVRAASAVDGVAEGFVAVSFELLARWPLRFGGEVGPEVVADAVVGPDRGVAWWVFDVGHTEPLGPVTGASLMRDLVAQRLEAGALEVSVGRPLRLVSEELRESGCEFVVGDRSAAT